MGKVAVSKIDEMEICRLYKEAKYQKMQERILADMYLCDVAEIREILKKHGAYNENGRAKCRNTGRAKGSHFTKGKKVMA